MSKEIFEKNKVLLDEIKSKFGVYEIGDPSLSPELSPFVFLADRDPTGTEPDIYNGYPGLILMWENTTTGDFFISPDNTASPLVWNKIVTDANINSVLYKAQGSATLSLGSATVSCPSLASGNQIQLEYKSPAGTPGSVFVTSVTPGTGFTIGSTSLLDTSTISWNVLN